MDAVRVAVGCTVAGLLAVGGLSHLSPATGDQLLSGLHVLFGERPAVGAPASVDPRPVRLEQTPSAAMSAGSGEEVIRPDAGGQFATAVEIEGERLPVLVDTGATFVALSYEDADRLGIRPSPADFSLPMATANGRAFAAPVRLRAVRLGGIEVRDVPAIVVGRGQLGRTLLGMSFLSRLSGFAVRDGRLFLRP